MGTVRVYNGNSIFTLEIAGSYPIGDIFERALLISHRTWHDIEHIEIENHNSRWTWNITENWWTPAIHLWNRQSRSFNIHLIGWDYRDNIINREWIYNLWNRSYTEWRTEMNNIYERERQTYEISGLPQTNRRRRALNRQNTDHTNSNSNSNSNSTLNNSLYSTGVNFFSIIIDTLSSDEPEPQNQNVLTLETLNQLCPEQEYAESSSNGYEEVTCPIAREIIQPGDYVRTLPCSHLFKSNEITRWLTANSSNCPVCRKQVDLSDNQRMSYYFQAM